jgi:hypothetical protein
MRIARQFGSRRTFPARQSRAFKVAGIASYQAVALDVVFFTLSRNAVLKSVFFPTACRQNGNAE